MKSIAPGPILAVVSAGGVVGSLARYGLEAAFPHSAAGFPFATFGINVSGCLLIGVLMVVVIALAYLATTLIAALAAVWVAPSMWSGR